MKAMMTFLCITGAVLIAAGCGDDNDSNETETQDTRTTTTEKTIDAARFDLQTLNDSGVVGEVTIKRARADEVEPSAEGADVEAEVDNGSAQASTEDEGALLRVTIQLEGEETNQTPRPAHIHKGASCDDVDPAPLFPLTNVVAGMSETVLAVTGTPLDEGDYVINVHESEQNIEEYVACGELPSKEMAELLAGMDDESDSE